MTDKQYIEEALKLSFKLCENCLEWTHQATASQYRSLASCLTMILPPNTITISDRILLKRHDKIKTGTYVFPKKQAKVEQLLAFYVLYHKTGEKIDLKKDKDERGNPKYTFKVNYWNKFKQWYDQNHNPQIPSETTILQKNIVPDFNLFQKPYSEEEKLILDKYLGVYLVYYRHTGDKDKIMRGGLEIKYDEQHQKYVAFEKFKELEDDELTEDEKEIQYWGIVRHFQNRLFLFIESKSKIFPEPAYICIYLSRDSKQKFKVLLGLFSAENIANSPHSAKEVIFRTDFESLDKINSKYIPYDKPETVEDKLALKYIQQNQPNSLTLTKKAFESLADFEEYIDKQDKKPYYGVLENFIGSYYAYAPKSDGTSFFIRWACLIYKKDGGFHATLKGNGHILKSVELSIQENHLYIDYESSDGFYQEKYRQIFIINLETNHEILYGICSGINTKQAVNASKIVMHLQQQPFQDFDAINVKDKYYQEKNKIPFSDIDKYTPNSPEFIILQYLWLTKDRILTTEHISNISDLKEKLTKIQVPQSTGSISQKSINQGDIELLKTYQGFYYVYYPHTGGEHRLMKGALEIGYKQDTFYIKEKFQYNYIGGVELENKIIYLNLQNEFYKEKAQIMIPLESAQEESYPILTAIFQGWNVNEKPCSVLEMIVKTDKIKSLDEFEFNTKGISFDSPTNHHEELIIQYFQQQKNWLLTPEIKNFSSFEKLEKHTKTVISQFKDSNYFQKLLSIFKNDNHTLLQNYVGVYHGYFMRTDNESEIRKVAAHIFEDGTFRAYTQKERNQKNWFEGVVFIHASYLYFLFKNIDSYEVDFVVAQISPNTIYSVLSCTFSGINLKGSPCSGRELAIRQDNLQNLSQTEAKYFKFDHAQTKEEKLVSRYFQLQDNNLLISEPVSSISLESFENEVFNLENKTHKKHSKPVNYEQLKKYIGDYYVYEPKSDGKPFLMRWLCRIYEQNHEFLAIIKGHGYIYYGKLRILDSTLYIDYLSQDSQKQEEYRQVFTIENIADYRFIHGTGQAINSAFKTYSSQIIMYRQSTPFTNFEDKKGEFITLNYISSDENEVKIFEYFRQTHSRLIIAEPVNNFFWSDTAPYSQSKIPQHSQEIQILIDKLVGVYLDFFYDFVEDELEWNVYELFPDGSFNRKDNYEQGFDGSWIITGEDMFIRIVDKKVSSNRYYDTTFKIDVPKNPFYLVGFGYGVNQNNKIKLYKDVMIKQDKPFSELKANRILRNSPEYQEIITQFPDLEKHLFSFSKDIFTSSSISLVKNSLTSSSPSCLKSTVTTKSRTDVLRKLSGYYQNIYFNYKKNTMNLRYFQLFVDGSFQALDDKTVGGKICLTQGGKIALFIYQKPDREQTYISYTFIDNTYKPKKLVSAFAGFDHNNNLKYGQEYWIRMTQVPSQKQIKSYKLADINYLETLQNQPEILKLISDNQCFSDNNENIKLAEKHFNSACFLAMKGKKAEALTDLNWAFTYGFRDKALLTEELNGCLQSIQNQIDVENFKVLTSS